MGAWWPLHPLDDDGARPDAVHGVYLGAAGVLWALDQLARAGLHEPGHDYARLAARRASRATGGGPSSAARCRACGSGRAGSRSWRGG